MKLVPRDINAHFGGDQMILLKLARAVADNRAIYMNDAAFHFVVDSVGNSSQFQKHSEDRVVVPVLYRSSDNPNLSFDAESTR